MPNSNDGAKNRSIPLDGPLSSRFDARLSFARKAEANFQALSFYNTPVQPTWSIVLSSTAATLPVLPKRVPIPSTFYAEDTEAPFEECMACERPLRENSMDYIIEKGYRSYAEYGVEETIFGYALCLPCHAQITESFSAGSKRRCQSYLNTHIDLEGRTTALLEEDPPDPDRWTEHCIVNETPKDDLQEYQTLAHCRGEDMLLTHLPLMIGGPAVDDLVQRLSNETLDELGGFRREFFDLPPDLKRNPQGPVLA